MRYQVSMETFDALLADLVSTRALLDDCDADPRAVHEMVAARLDLIVSDFRRWRAEGRRLEVATYGRREAIQ